MRRCQCSAEARQTVPVLGPLTLKGSSRLGYIHTSGRLGIKWWLRYFVSFWREIPLTFYILVFAGFRRRSVTIILSIHLPAKR